MIFAMEVRKSYIYNYNRFEHRKRGLLIDAIYG